RRDRRPGAARRHRHRHAGDPGEGLAGDRRGGPGGSEDPGDPGDPGNRRRLMRDFQFHRPKSVADAVALLRANDSAKLLAGGQSLLPVMKLDLAEPTDLVSLAAIA